MGTRKQEMKGKLERAAGSVQRTAGEALGDEEMRTEGEGRRAKGRLREEAAKTAGQLKGAARKALGKAQEKAADILGNRSQQAKGAARRTKGDVQRKTY